RPHSTGPLLPSKLHGARSSNARCGACGERRCRAQGYPTCPTASGTPCSTQVLLSPQAGLPAPSARSSSSACPSAAAAPPGGGLPAGVRRARSAGVSPAIMAALYFVSDIVLAVTFEPFVRLVSWLGRYLPPVAWLVGAMRGLAARSGATAGGAKGPLGL